MGRPPGTTVFVGNISYDTTEDQLKEVFSQVGTVLSFRLMYDHETGRAKGFGFCEYEDKETAMSARRNLNGTQLNGRPLRVDLTESDKQHAAQNGLILSPPPQPPPANPPRAPSHAALPPALSSATPSMTNMSLAEIHQTMMHLKKALVHNPNEMRELLIANPRLAHAILQGQIMLGMVPPPMPPQQQPAAAPINPPRPPPQRPPQQRPPPQQPMPAQPQRAPPPMAPPPQQRLPQRPMPPPPQQPVPMPPPPRPMQNAPMLMQQGMLPPQGGMQPPQNVAAQGMGQQGMQQGMGQQGVHMGMGPPGGGMDEQAVLLRKVMAMSQQDIDALPPEHRDYVLQLKEILRMQGGGMGMNAPPPQQPPPGGMPQGGQYR